MKVRDEERWAQDVIASTLSARVCRHDDQSRNGMHDLSIAYAEKPVGAVEVTTAIDEDLIGFWKAAVLAQKLRLNDLPVLT